MSGYQNDLAFLGRGIGDVAPFLVMIVVLLIRPRGAVRDEGAGPCLSSPARVSWAPPAVGASLVAAAVAVPFYLEGFWLQAGLFAMSAAIGAIGINLLTGATGQLSMGHAFFLAVGPTPTSTSLGSPGPAWPGWACPRPSRRCSR